VASKSRERFAVDGGFRGSADARGREVERTGSRLENGERLCAALGSDAEGDADFTKARFFVL
jgi:hypothetical protein